MIDKLVSFIIPHRCFFCQKVGAAVCSDCTNYIILESQKDKTLTNCLISGVNLYCVGWRRGSLRKIVDEYKFNLKRELATPLARLLLGRLPDLTNQSVVVVSVPTTRKHNRQRGFDHMRLVGKELAKLLDGFYQPILRRANQTSQRGLKRAQRLKNAQKSFKIDGELDRELTYLVVDDVWTTGATITTVVDLLKQHGAKKIVAAVICRQPEKRLNKIDLI